jgi:hypothetical protein
MKQMNRVVRTGVALLTGAALTMTAAGSASAVTPNSCPTQIPMTFKMANGNQFSTGQPNPVAGNPIIQTTGPGRTFTFCDSTTVGEFDFPAGTMELANGNFMAANDACTGVTIKSNSGSNGTVWYLINTTPSPDFMVASRFCMHGGDNIVIYGDNTQGDQWKFCDSGPNADTCGTGKFFRLTH